MTLTLALTRACCTDGTLTSTAAACCEDCCEDGCEDGCAVVAQLLWPVAQLLWTAAAAVETLAVAVGEIEEGGGGGAVCAWSCSGSSSGERRSASVCFSAPSHMIV